MLTELTQKRGASWTLARACDLYVSAFLLPKLTDERFAGPDGLPRRGSETVPTSGALWEYLRGVSPFGPMFAAEIRKKRIHHRSFSNWRWHLDEVFVRINGEMFYLWRAVDHEGRCLRFLRRNGGIARQRLRF